MTPLPFVNKILRTEERIEEQPTPGRPSNRIGASSLGDLCKRQIWLKWRNVKQSMMMPRVLRLFGRGHQEEQVVYKDLEAIGIKIISTQDFITFCNGYAAGMHDGIIENVPDAPKTPHLLEIKTGNEKAYNSLKKYGLKKGKPEHYTQMQVYMALFKLKRGLYIFTHKDTDYRHYERIKDDKEAVTQAMERVEGVVTSVGPPPKMDLDRYPCHAGTYYCTFWGICHSNDPVQEGCRTCEHVNLLGEGAWGCGIRNDKVLKPKKQQKGCKKWQINQLL